MNVMIQNKKGCERHLELEVVEPNDPSVCPYPKLDRRAKGIVGRFPDHTSVMGYVSIRWKSVDNREQCRIEQTLRNRWRCVEDYASSMNGGAMFPPSVFLSPTLTNEGMYILVDGARRIMAAAEAGTTHLKCTILR